MLMTRERRAFSWLLGLIVLLAGAMSGRTGEADKYLPSDAEAVVTINVKQVLSAPLVEPFIKQVKEKWTVASELQQAQQDIGFDPLRDVERVTLAVGQDPRKLLVLVQGRFDTARIQAKAPEVAQKNKDILKIHRIGSYTVYEVQPPEENQPLFLTVLDERMVALSQDRSRVIDVLDKKAGKKTAALKKDLQQLLTQNTAEPSIGVLALPGPLAATGQPLAERVKTIAGSITVTNEVKLQLVLNAADAKDAKAVATELNDTLEQLKALVENAAQVDSRLQPAVDAAQTLKVTAQDNAVTLTGQISKEVLDSISKLLTK